jgi:poly(hydroxyalkanoate) depolymerase family esterase
MMMRGLIVFKDGDFAKYPGQRNQWEEFLPSAGRLRPDGAVGAHLLETSDPGPNPGALRMFSYVPSRLAADPALVVVLHGCTQTAAGYDRGAGWSTLAERNGFALLLPEQQRSNNPNCCFNWFQAGDIERGCGEAASIRQMVEKMVRDIGIDRRRIFVTGLSAGGAMTSVMLACYPDVFAAGAIIAGVPYGAATNVQQAFQSMLQSRARPAREWGDLVRGASSHRGPWPRVSVWHGGADTTVIPSNAREIVKQWTNVHGLPSEPSAQATVDGYPHHVWRDGAGNELIEFYAITHMAHGTPLAPGNSDDECGAAGPYLLDVGISSSHRIARFFGLVDGRRLDVPGHLPATMQPEDDAGTSTRRDRGGPRADLPASAVLEGEILDREVDEDRTFAHAPPRSGIDVGAVIRSALKAAGLMKDR